MGRLISEPKSEIFSVNLSSLHGKLHKSQENQVLDGSGEHYAKWNGPGGGRQTIPYDLTYKWNLINTTNKEAKNNQRHWNKEQTDSNQRGGEEG